MLFFKSTLPHAPPVSSHTSVFLSTSSKNLSQDMTGGFHYYMCTEGLIKGWYLMIKSLSSAFRSGRAAFFCTFAARFAKSSTSPPCKKVLLSSGCTRLEGCFAEWQEGGGGVPFLCEDNGACRPCFPHTRINTIIRAPSVSARRLGVERGHCG